MWFLSPKCFHTSRSKFVNILWPKCISSSCNQYIYIYIYIIYIYIIYIHILYIYIMGMYIMGIYMKTWFSSKSLSNLSTFLHDFLGPKFFDTSRAKWFDSFCKYYIYCGFWNNLAQKVMHEDSLNQNILIPRNHILLACGLNITIFIALKTFFPRIFFLKSIGILLGRSNI